MPTATATTIIELGILDSASDITSVADDVFDNLIYILTDNVLARMAMAKALLTTPLPLPLDDISNFALSLPCRLRAFGASFGEARHKFSQFCIRDTLFYIFNPPTTPI